MKGSIRKPPDPNRPHLANDYRDPPPLKLPPVPKYKMKEKEDKMSMAELKSDETVWDALRDLKLMKRGSVTTYKSLRDRQRSILLNLPHLDERQIRNYTTPMAEHLPQELLEDNYYFASCFLLYLIDVNDELTEGSSAKVKEERLRNRPQVLELLARLLKALDKYLEEGDIEHFCSLSFYCGVHFEKKKAHWWLANEFYELALEVSHDINYDYGYAKALINYMYGKFLVIKGKNYSDAIQCLKVAKSITKGKIWDVEWLTRIKNEKIAENSNYLIHLALLLLAEEIHREHPKSAMLFTKEAAEIAKCDNWEEEWLEAMLDYLLYCSDANKLLEEFSTINELKLKCLKEDNVGVFSYLELLSAKYHLQNNDLVEAFYCLSKLDYRAKKNDMHHLRALVLRYMAQISILQANTKKAQSYLNLAVKIHEKIGNENELSRCKNLIEVAKARDSTPGECRGHEVEILSHERTTSAENRFKQ